MNPRSFLIEFVLRFTAKSPVFFKILQLVSAIVSLGGVFVSNAERWFNWQVPDHTANLLKDAALVALGIFTASMATADTRAIGVKDDGTILKATNEKKLPFTTKVEEKQAIKELGKVDVSPEVVTMKDDVK